jgi:hypothetical protein
MNQVVIIVGAPIRPRCILPLGPSYTRRICINEVFLTHTAHFNLRDSSISYALNMP